MSSSPAPTPSESVTPFEFQPKQVELAMSSAPCRLAVGGIRSGKTSGALIFAIYYYVLMHEKCDILVLRKTFRELETGAITDLKTFVPPQLYEYNESKHIATFVNGSRVIFGHCQRGVEADIMQYLGQAYPFILVDECAQFSPDAWEILSSRNTVNAGCQPNKQGKLPSPVIWGCTNPIGAFWNFYRSMFVDKKPYDPPQGSKRAKDGSWWVEEYGEKRCIYDPNRYAYTHSTIMDNKALLERDPQILVRLNALSKAKRDKLLFGFLDKVDGQYYDVFSPEHHVINLRENPEAIIWQDWQPVWMGWDWGMAHWNAVHFFTKAMVKSTVNNDYKMMTVCFREFVTQGLGQEELVKLVAQLARNPVTGKPLRVQAIYFSHEKFNRIMEQHSPADVLSNLLRQSGLPPVSRATRDRVGSATYLYNVLQRRDLVILDNCVETIAAIPSLQRDAKCLDDYVKVDSKADDVADSFRYGLYGEFASRQMPEEEAFQRKIESVTDPFARKLLQVQVGLRKTVKERYNIFPGWARGIREPVQQ